MGVGNAFFDYLRGECTAMDVMTAMDRLQAESLASGVHVYATVEEMLEVLTGFIEESLADRQYFLAIARQGPVWARQRLRDIADDEAAHARRLLAAHYLITGQCYRPAVRHGPVCVGQWCAALRERYHLEACSGFNYARAADGTTDPCLSRLFNELSADEYRHADTILRLLERSLPG